jgi:sugar lactone lactonase YvrE
VTLATSPNGWGPLAVDSTAVYGIFGAGGGNVVKVSLCGGTPITVARANAMALAIDATNVYWTDSPIGADLTVYAAGKTGGTPRALATLSYAPPYPARGASGIAVDSSAVYVLGLGDTAATCSGSITHCQPGYVIRVPLDGAAPTTLATLDTQPSAIAVDATGVYWVTMSPAGAPGVPSSQSQGTVVSAPLAGGSVTTLATGRTQPQGLSVQGSMLYWVDLDGMIVSLPTSGGMPKTVTGSDLLLQGMAVDAEGVYVDEAGSIETFQPTGGMPTTIATANADYSGVPAGVALDATSVYWGNGNDLLRAPK